MSTSRARTPRVRGTARRIIERPPAPRGWHSDEALELERRRWRGESEILAADPIEVATPHFGRFSVRSTSGSAYEVELRALDRPLNTCGCVDFAVNGLGTCKHIEGALGALRRRGVRRFAAATRDGSPRIEAFLARAGAVAPAILWPRATAQVTALRTELARFVDRDGKLRDALEIESACI